MKKPKRRKVNCSWLQTRAGDVVGFDPRRRNPNATGGQFFMLSRSEQEQKILKLMASGLSATVVASITGWHPDAIREAVAQGKR